MVSGCESGPAPRYMHPQHTSKECGHGQHEDFTQGSAKTLLVSSKSQW